MRQSQMDKKEKKILFLDIVNSEQEEIYLTVVERVKGLGLVNLATSQQDLHTKKLLVRQAEDQMMGRMLTE